VFSPEHVLITAAEGGRSFPESVAFWRAALARARAVPGVTAAAVSSRPPIHNVRRRPFVVEGSPAPAPEAAEQAGDVFVSAEYFAALGIPILKGRAFLDSDNETSRPVVVISESVARRAFGATDPLGRRIALVEHAPLTCCSAPGPLDGVWREVVGVVRDVRQANLDERPAPTIYRPFTQVVEHDMFVVLRLDGRTAEGRVAAAVRAALTAPGALPQREWDDVRTMADVIHESGSIRMRRFVLILLGGFAAIALALAAVGVFGVASSTVTERTKEIGVRMALGATGPAILRQLLGELLVLAGAGFAAGTAAMLAVTRVIQSMLFGIGPTDAATYAGAAGVLTAAIVLAACAPARRAIRVDPMIALRGD